MPKYAARTLLSTLCLASALSAQPAVASAWRQFEDPADAGFDAGKLEAVYTAADEAGSGALLIVRGGTVVVAYGDVARKFRCHSMRKSFLSALIGREVARGTIDLDRTLAEFGIDDLGGLSEVERSATLRQLIMARSGIYHPAAKEPGGMKEGRPERGSSRPGEAFFYNNWDFNTAGVVYEQQSGKDIFQAFRDELAAPTGMEDFEVGDGTHQFERKLSMHPAYDFRLSARDAARFGQLYLQRGSWDGRQVIPEQWIDESWQSHSDLGDGRGYGYMWWIWEPGGFPERPELAAYAASGMGGHLIVVVPTLELVIVHRADTDFGRGTEEGVAMRLVKSAILAIEGPYRADAGTTTLQPRPFSKPLPPLDLPATIAMSAEQLESYVGDYLINEQMRCSLRRLDDVLVGELSGFGEADFWPVGSDRFFGRAVGAFLDFERGSDGTIAAVRVSIGGREMIAKRVSD